MTDPPPPPRTTAIASSALTLLWCANVVALIGATAWIFVDPRVAQHLAAEEHKLTAPFQGPNAGVVDPVDPTSPRAFAITIIACIVLASLVALGAALFFGPPERRRVRSWLGLTTLVALWLGLAVGWRDLSWAGTRWRLDRQLAAFQPLADELAADWPTDDGALPGLGQFSAYPVGRPRMLMLIAADPAATHAPIAAVERSDAGALRFQLAGQETGAWLEWHPAGSTPASFTGGLDDPHDLAKSAPLSEHWFATRYR